MACCGQDVAIEVWPLEPVVCLPPEPSVPEVRARAGVLAEVQGQALASPLSEVGGLLLGGVQVEGTTVCVEVAACLPAEAVRSGPCHLAFTHETWRRIRERRRAEHPGTLAVGWYHSHPGLGLFLSGLDRALHAQIFGEQPWCVALVVDPLQTKRAFFWPGPEGVLRCTETVV